MRNSERQELIASLVSMAQGFRAAAHRYRRQKMGDGLIRDMVGLRIGVMLSARMVKGSNTGAYMANLPARVERRRAA